MKLSNATNYDSRDLRRFVTAAFVTLNVPADQRRRTLGKDGAEANRAAENLDRWVASLVMGRRQ